MPTVSEPPAISELYSRVNSIHLDDKVHLNLFAHISFEELKQMFHGNERGNIVITKILAGNDDSEGGLRVFCPVAKLYEEFFAKPFPPSTQRSLRNFLRERRKTGFGILIRNFIAAGAVQTGGLFSFQRISKDCLQSQTSGLHSADMESFLGTFAAYVEFLRDEYGPDNAMVYIYDSLFQNCKGAWTEALKPRILTMSFCMGLHPRVSEENLVKRLPQEVVRKIGLLVLEDLGK